MNIEQKIIYYKQIKWNIPFRELHHTVVTVCDFVKPIYPNIEPLKYIEFFLKEIEFDKIENNTNKAETLKYCYAIYYGLEQILKADISKAILNYQNSISKLSKEQIQETQIKIVELIGNLKRQARTNEAGISFTQRYNALYKSIEAKKELSSFDYQILISHFNETILNDLLSSFEIINDTFKEITPLLKASPPQQTKTEQEIPKTFEELFYNPEHADPCLKILNELQPPVIDAMNNYIGKSKGVFPLWVKVLKNHKPQPLIKHFKDTVYKDLLNQKIKGLNLSKDASEFRKQYVRLENDKIELDIKAILSQFSQSGKLGK